MCKLSSKLLVIPTLSADGGNDGVGARARRDRLCAPEQLHFALTTLLPPPDSRITRDSCTFFFKKTPAPHTLFSDGVGARVNLIEPLSADGGNDCVGACARRDVRRDARPGTGRRGRPCRCYPRWYVLGFGEYQAYIGFGIRG